MLTRVWIAAIGVCGALAGQPALRLKSGRVPAPLVSIEDQPARLAARAPQTLDSGRMHAIVQFRSEPDAQTVKTLAERGARVLAFVPDNGFLISIENEIDLTGLEVFWAGPLEPEDKISALLGAVLGSAAPRHAYLMKDPEDIVAVVVDLHEDEEPMLARYRAIEAGWEVLEHPDLAPHQILVRGRREALAALAGRDEVAYLFPAADELLRGAPLQACAGPLWAAAPLGSAVNLAATFGDGWDGAGLNSAALSYWFGILAPGFPRDAVQTELERALAAWSAVVRIDFTLAATPGLRRGIDMYFAAGAHGDGYNFDGRGRVLAHGFFPPPNSESLAGDLHFDAEEMWRLVADVDVFSVALHELGHTLGLGHSDDVNAVMYPYYRKATALNAADIDAIRTLYAARTAAPAPPTTPPPTPAPPPPPPTTPPPTPPVAPDTTPPSITVTTPSSTYLRTHDASIVLRGTAKDNVAVARVVWKRGLASGTATGTTSWTTPAISLPMGTSTFIVRAYDAAGNSAWKTLTVVRY